MARSAHQPTAPGTVASGGVPYPVDVAVGASALAVATTLRVTRRVGSALRPVARAALRPPLVPQDLQPERIVASVARVGSAQRIALGRELSRRLDVIVPAVLAEVLRRAHLDELLPRYVDLDAVVAAVDLDAAAARLELDPVVERVDVDSILDRVDLTSVVLERVDLDAVLGAVLDRIDLTSVVLERVDLGVVVDAALAKVDMVAVTALAEEVIDAVDLPEIIRESTGSMASDTVRGARMQSINADEAVGRAVDRLLLRRGRRVTEAPAATTPSSPPDETATAPAIPSQTDRRR